MTIVERIAEHLKSPPLNEDGELHGTKLLPPLEASSIDDLERQLKCCLSQDTRMLLEYCGGFEEGPMEFVDFKGEEVNWIGMPMLVSRMRLISQDGFGNFWFYWNTQVSADLGPIYYYQHEGPMLFYQSVRLVDFVDECLRFMTPPYKSLIDDVHEFRIKPIKDLNLDLLSREAALASSDDELKLFAAKLPEGSLLYDFSRAKIGDGIDLQKLEIVAVHPTRPLLAVTRRVSFFRRLFGK